MTAAHSPLIPLGQATPWPSEDLRREHPRDPPETASKVPGAFFAILHPSFVKGDGFSTTESQMSNQTQILKPPPTPPSEEAKDLLQGLAQPS